MTRPGIEPQSPEPLANTLTARPMDDAKFHPSLDLLAEMYLKTLLMTPYIDVTNKIFEFKFMNKCPNVQELRFADVHKSLKIELNPKPNIELLLIFMEIKHFLSSNKNRYLITFSNS